MKERSWYQKIILGLIVAATGVGAGDLITASLAGSNVGLVLVWAAVAGSILKWVLNEGIARWQMATGTTLLEGAARHLGRWVEWIFMIYFILWSYFVGGALINGCGVAGGGLLPVGDPNTSKIIWGIIHSLVGFALVWRGGFKAFEIAMSICTAIMVGTVLVTVILISPDWAGILRGLVIPSIPKQGMGWLLGVLGGVGGTVTLLSYSYWIREKGRSGRKGISECRLDLSVAYGLTAFFGAAMIIIGSRVTVTGRGDTVALILADQLARALGPWGKWVFLAGFWGAVFTSLLGVWQGVPYLFADFIRLRRGRPAGRGEGEKLKTDKGDANVKNAPEKDAEESGRKAIERGPSAVENTRTSLTKTRAYRGYLVALAVLPLTTLLFKVQQIQLIYAVLGSFFMPLLALALLLLNNRARLVGRDFRNNLVTNMLLVLTLGFFAYAGLRELVDLFAGR
jgi:Mn2+/Fe2+ NRAMP family transporter